MVQRSLPEREAIVTTPGGRRMQRRLDTPPRVITARVAGALEDGVGAARRPIDGVAEATRCGEERLTRLRLIGDTSLGVARVRGCGE